MRFTARYLLEVIENLCPRITRSEFVDIRGFGGKLETYYGGGCFRYVETDNRIKIILFAIPTAYLFFTTIARSSSKEEEKSENATASTSSIHISIVNENFRSGRKRRSPRIGSYFTYRNIYE